jgi:hypothetical protein
MKRTAEAELGLTSLGNADHDAPCTLDTVTAALLHS